MTYKLIALMTVVLLLSLGASALLMNHYRDQVMDELAHTVSDVGRATLRTFDFSQTYRFQTGVGGPRAGDVTVDLHPAAPGLMKVERLARADSDVAFGVSDEEGTPEGYVVIAYDTGTGASGAAPGSAPGGDPELEFAQIEQEVHVVSSDPDETPEARRRVRVVRLDEVRTEPNPEGFVLRIPTLQADDATAQRIGGHWVSDPRQGSSKEKPGSVRREDLLLQVPTADYQDLFDTARNRSTMVFLGVFVVGTVLSAGLASRFTRPVRRLDAAIHRLSAGDLEARVPVRGSDEVARLGRAFNSMAQSLRANRERAAELTRREKLSALGRLAAGVAHDVRNPLHSVNLTLQHLQETCRPESVDRRAEFDRSIGIIRAEIKRLDGLVENFLRFARSDRRERVPVDLAGLARETARLVEKEAERRGISVRVEAPGSLPTSLLDVESVRSSILNLVLNGFEAMPHGGRLDLSVTVQGGQIEIRVSDTGRGIPEEDQERVFDFAYTTREGGSGLGLAMVHQVVVDEHGGAVRLDSRLGEGTTITLSFPVVAEARS